MIAAIYSVDLYCDCEECIHWPFTGTYTGNSWTECSKEARKDGWRISRDRERAFAPNHKIRSLKE
ncbi:hypothetical protein [Pantoea vagans]|uniref:hypothetical protein n=1 Tax=Pantoea vagans TaxID=470934 RepID=UPI000949968B|nr:hypothetical protein [Pantoea vagans]